MLLRNLFLTFAIATSLAATPVLAAPAPQSKKEPTVQSVQGCLSPALEEGLFILETPAGEEIVVSGPADLKKHLGHTVKLTGKLAAAGGKKRLEVTKIEHLSSQCSL